MAELSRLGKYKGLVVPGTDATVTDQDVEEVLKQLASQASQKVKVDRAAQNGDSVLIDYKGLLDGVAFAGGTAENYVLTLGSNTFIPGFEEQLVGASAGDHVDVHVSFPEQYHAPDLAGKAVVFEVEVHEVQEDAAPEMNDAFAASVSPFKTISELRADLKQRMTTQKESEARYNRFLAALDQIMGDSDVTATEDEVEEMIDLHIENVRLQTKQNGMTLENYLQFTGQTMEQLRDQLKSYAQDDVFRNAILDAIVKEEGLEASEEEVNAELNSMAAQYNMSVEDLLKQLGDNAHANLSRTITVNKAQNVILNSLKEA